MCGTMKALTCLLTVALTQVAAAAEYRIVPDESIIAVVTHKAGIAAGLAHDHLIAATGYEADLRFDPADPSATRLEFSLRATDLIVDDPGLRDTWYPRIAELGILSEPFEAIEEDGRKKVRKAMLGKKQLEADRFPEIKGTILVVKPNESDAEFPYLVTLAFEAHGTRIEPTLQARWQADIGSVELEAFGTLRFTELGIKPYSAFMGTVRNRDELHLYVRLEAVPAMSARP